MYGYAKLRMLQFHYDCIDRYIDRCDYQLCEMDTDSLYIALAHPTLEEAVKPSKKLEFYKDYHNWFPSPACQQHRELFVNAKMNNQVWLPQGECCLRQKARDKRTPGLFKLEFKGEGIVALCSKT